MGGVRNGVCRVGWVLNLDGGIPVYVGLLVVLIDFIHCDLPLSVFRGIVLIISGHPHRPHRPGDTIIALLGLPSECRLYIFRDLVLAARAVFTAPRRNIGGTSAKNAS